jgi:hypothetical protein
VKFEISKVCDITFGISQIDKRVFLKDSGYEYSDCRLALWQSQLNDKLEGNNIYIKGCHSIQARDCYLELEQLP